MFYIFLAFFVVASGFASADELCAENEREACPVDEEKVPRKFPTTAEDLQKACDFFIKWLDCGIEFEERCHKMPEMLPAAYDIYAVFQEICNPDSLLHEAVVNNLECFYDTIMTEGRSCFRNEPDLDILNMQAKELVKEGFEGIGDDNEDENSYACLSDLNVLACESLVLEQKCGKIAMNAFLDIIPRTTAFIVDISCDKQGFKMLPSIVRLRRLENEIEETLKRRRK